MARRHSINFLIAYSLAFCSTISLTACSFSDITYLTKSPGEKKAILHESPKFWEDTTAVDGSNNLSILHNVAFEGQPYNDIRSFGDNILMIGQGNYNNSLIDAQQQTIEYSFDVYDPWSNEIVASLDHSDIHCDSYLVKGDKLWLIDSSAGKVTIYDSALNQTGTKKYNPESDFEEFDTPVSCNPYNYYSAMQLCTSEDGKYALVSGVSPDTYRYEVSNINLDSGSAISSYEGESYSLSAVGKDGFVIQTDISNNLWNYHSNSGKDCFFQLSDVNDVDMTDDGSVIFRQQKFPDDNTDENQYISCYKYSPDGDVLSSFRYDLGVYGSNDFTFCSSDNVYLKDANCVMLLLYTAQCNPQILVWSLDDGKNDSNTDIPSYSSDEELIKVLIDNDTYVSPYDATDETYGADVTLIPDPDSYDWGNLAEINERATQIENQYGISIYLGKEVPTQIDYYSIRQETDYDKLDNAMYALENALSYYPEGFFEQLLYGDVRGLRLYLTGSVSSDSTDMINEAAGFVNVINNYDVMVLDCNYSWDWSYTIGHEMSHLIDQKLSFIHSYNEKSLYSEEKWSSFNPDNFSYNDTYSGYDPDSSQTVSTKYFIDSYGMTYATEDRAEIFGTAIDNYTNGINDDSRFYAGSPIHDKLDYYCKCIRDGFDTSEWSDELPWETVLH